MEFLKPKIIVKKDEEGNYLLKKKANILLILSLFELHPKSWTKIGGAVQREGIALAFFYKNSYNMFNF